MLYKNEMKMFSAISAIKNNLFKDVCFMKMCLCIMEHIQLPWNLIEPILLRDDAK
jgi:hypothetical protein